MPAQPLESLLKQIDLLRPDEQLRLVSMVIERARKRMSSARARLKWKDVCGLLPYPALGEDAQTHVSRTRREGDLHRQAQLRRAS